MPKALLLENIHPDAAQSLRDHGFEVECLRGALNEDELIAALEDVDLLGIRSKTSVTSKVIDARPTLTAVGCFCIGTNQVDLDYAGKHGIAVFNAHIPNTRSVVELVIGDIICLMRRIPAHTHHMKHGMWTSLLPDLMKCEARRSASSATAISDLSFRHRRGTWHARGVLRH